MKCIFVTVGTTSFDELIESICSMSFLIATLYTQSNITRRPPSNQSVSSSQSTLDPQQLEIHLSSKSSPSIPPSSQFSQPSSSTDLYNGEISENGVEIVIQYGTGQCPLQFLPSEIKKKLNRKPPAEEDSILVSIPFDGEHLSKRAFLHLKWYRFKPSLTSEMERATLILCHAGAGTLLEALSLKRPENISISSTDYRVINAVSNSKLMGNHQSELANELEKQKYILATKDVKKLATLTGAYDFWNKINGFVPKTFHRKLGETDPIKGMNSFQRIVDRVMDL